MSHGKQFTLFTHAMGPNGWKVAYVLAELGLDYEPRYLEFDKQEQKSPEHLKYNPNGRIPTLIDHGNDDFVIWESNAIMVYLVEKYDIERKISVSDADEKAQQLQWLFFQASGQGPYYGQAAWFNRRHPEKIPSAIERYQQEVIRVLGVLESVLSKQDWLVGGKCTIADISFVPWNAGLTLSLLLGNKTDFNLERDFPAVNRWHNAMVTRKAIAEQIQLRESLVTP
ncbi:glutathione S-transferase C-terminal-like protein [Fomitopsis serialis]|uniref:glutathione S-transferase C-terminal-like protein n=1 Tax=Fomitopsis serialis TaxID=139415 RepID=UPI00200814A4|nr:glutathione S-transferase C-terminal-like protein [Neoantrodia serialis]KAH9919704.1 glutathione S-transferase C-terminal-like protein [Neoantrodia serialis]